MPVLPIPRWTDDLCEPSRNEVNSTTTPPAHRLDSVKFRASSNAPGVSKVTSYTYLDNQDAGRRNTSNFLTELLTRSDFVDVLRIVFIVLDAILFVYRFSHTYCNATSLCCGFDDCLPLEGSISLNGGSGRTQNHKQHGKNSGHNNIGASKTSGGHTRQYDQIDSISEKPQLRSSLRTHSSVADTVSSTQTSKPDSVFSMKHRTWRSLLRFTVGLVRSSAMPKLIVACVVVLLVYNVLAVVSDHVDVDSVLHNGVLGEVLSRLDQDQTDQYLDIQADHLNTVSLKHYEAAMRTDLLNVEGLLAVFNAGVYVAVQRHVCRYRIFSS